MSILKLKLIVIYYIFAKIIAKTMLIKEQILNSIKKMPDDITFDELIDEIIFLNKVQKGIEQSEKNQTVSTDDAKKKLEKWLR